MNKLIELILIILGKLIIYKEGDAIVVDRAEPYDVSLALKTMGFKIIYTINPENHLKIIRKGKV